MNGQYKTSYFPRQELQALVEALQEAGLDWSAEWKARRHTQRYPDEDTTSLVLRKEGKLVLQQVGRNGFVRIPRLSEEEKQLLLSQLQRLHLYNRPDFSLGLALSGLYLMVQFFVVARMVQGIPAMLISLCTFLLMAFLGVAYARSLDQVDHRVYQLSGFIGIAAYLLTALASLLTLPLFIAIQRNALYHAIEDGPRQPAGGAS